MVRTCQLIYTSIDDDVSYFIQNSSRVWTFIKKLLPIFHICIQLKLTIFIIVFLICNVEDISYNIHGSISILPPGSFSALFHQKESIQELIFYFFQKIHFYLLIKFDLLIFIRFPLYRLLSWVPVNFFPVFTFSQR